MTGIIWACIATFLIAVSPVLAKAGTKKTDPALAGCVVGITYAIVTFIRTSGRITAYKYSYIEQKSWIFIILAGAAPCNNILKSKPFHSAPRFKPNIISGVLLRPIGTIS